MTEAISSSNSSNESDCRLVPINSIDLTQYLYKWFTIHRTDDETILNESWSSHSDCPTYPVEEFPCRVYMIDYDFDRRIRIWLNEREAQVTKCSDYIYQRYREDRMESCWVCKWVDINENWYIDPLEEIDETTIDKPDFYRLHGDRYTTYGDGGSNFLVYPVWIHENISISESRRKRLLTALYKLNNERKDFHPPPSPVEDIIDPDLLPFRPRSSFDRNYWLAKRLPELEEIYYDKDDLETDLRQGAFDNLSDHEKLRHTYEWLPSEFVIDKDGRVDIKTPIVHLPVLPEYKQTYDDIARVFHAMLPMFKKLKLIKTDINEEQKLQVIVKAQSYNLTAGMKYSGRWHTEGQTENIVAVGVYYLDVDDELEGGGLKFRPKVGPKPSYEQFPIDHAISSIKTGTAIVFANSIPHRFQKIRNLTCDDGRRRTFLNFFIVDPEHRIPMKSNEVILSPKDTIIETLHTWNDGRLPDLVLQKIFKMLKLSSTWDNENEAKEFRSHVRRAMLDEKSGWGWINWGNTGTVEFVRALCAWRPSRRQEAMDILRHTESE